MRLLDRRLVRLLVGLLLCLVVPPLIAYDNLAAQLVTPTFRYAMIGSVAAIVAGAYVLSQISGFPGITEGFYVVPAFSGSFGLIVAAFLMLRLDYARGVLFGSYAVITVWYLLVTIVRSRRTALRIAVVPGGETMRLATIEGPSWMVLAYPVLPVGGCDAVVADLKADLDANWEHFISDCALSGIPVYHFKQVMESLTGRVEIDHLSENDLGSLVPNYAYSQLKWTADWLLALVGSLVLLPVFAAIALAIKLDSPGPAFFTQERRGFRGRSFVVYKFRTMQWDGPVTGARESVTRDADPRVTRVGRFLRRTRFDELPQMFNILRGEMSWIGPRPEALSLSSIYEERIPYYPYRHIVKPGISGWAQVNQGHVADVDAVRAKLHYDFFYIRNYSPWLDLFILMRTVVTVLTGFGSR